VKDCLICSSSVQESLEPWLLCVKCFRSQNPFQKTLYKVFVSSWGKKYTSTKQFSNKLAGSQITCSMLQLTAGAVLGRFFLGSFREMNYERWATFFQALYYEDEVVFDGFLEEIISLRSQAPIDPKVARQLADRHFEFVAEKTFAQLDEALKAIHRFGIQIPSDVNLSNANRDNYAELLWKNEVELLEKQIEINHYLIWVETCTHLPTYAQIRSHYLSMLPQLESDAEIIIESLGHNVPEHAATMKLDKVLDDLEVSWPHLINRLRANGLYIFKDAVSATTVKSVLVRLLLAAEQSLPVQLMLWPSPKLQAEIEAWRVRSKLDKEPIVHFTNSSAPIDNTPRGYVARSWKNRWRRD
jgi:hypothetical protein